MALKLSDDTRKRLHEIIVRQAEVIANDFKEEMCKKYNTLIDLYYGEPYQTGTPHYARTGNLRNSYIPYFSSNNHSVIGGIEISGERMENYAPNFSGERFLEKYFFDPHMPSATWHGGDWRGGYGVPARFSVYKEMSDFYFDTVKKYRKKYGV